MQQQEYHEIGDVFEFKGMRLKVYNANDSDCALCALGRKGLDGCEEMICSFNNRADNNDVIFMETIEPLTGKNHIVEGSKMVDTLKQQIITLKEIMQTYPGKTIDNIVMQMEARIKEMEKGGEKP